MTVISTCYFESRAQSFSYEYDDEAKTAKLTGYTGTVTSYTLTIPGTVTYNGENYIVTNIGSHVFEGTNLRALKIGEGVEYIESYAFSNCTNLRTIYLPLSISQIQYRAFYGCADLHDIYVKTGTSPQLFADCLPNQETSNSTVHFPSYADGFYTNCNWQSRYGFYPESMEGCTSFKVVDQATGNEVTEIYLPPKSTYRLGIRMNPDADNKAASIKFESSDSKMVSVSQNGKLESFYTEGSCAITVTDRVTGQSKTVRVNTTPLSYSINEDEEVTINGFSPEAIAAGKNIGELEIGDTFYYEGYGCRIIGIADRAFQNQTEITKVDLGSSPKTIGTSAFEGCTSVTHVDDLQYQKSIGDYAFKDCHNLNQSYYAYSELTYLGRGAFMNCESISSLDLESAKNLEFISDEAFMGCTGIKASVYITTQIRRIGTRAFANCNQITTVNFETRSGYTKRLKEIGESAFEGTNIKNISLPTTVQRVERRAFYGCANAYKISLGNNIEYIGDEAFAGLSQVTSQLSIPSTCTYIGEKAFAGCENINYLYIYSKKPTTISNGAFLGCTGLKGSLLLDDGIVSIGDEAFKDAKFTKLVLPSTLERIGANAFASCSTLSSIKSTAIVAPALGDNAFAITDPLKPITVPDGTSESYYSEHWNRYFSFENEPQFFDYTLSNEDNQVITITGLREVAKGWDISNLSIPAEIEHEGTMYPVVHIGAAAFKGLTSLTSVSFPETLLSIGDEAFAGCTSLKGDLLLPDQIRNIGAAAFRNCNNITSLQLPDGLVSLGNGAFENCASLVGTITFPQGIEIIPDAAFSGCVSINGFISNSVINEIGARAFAGCISLEGHLSIPVGVNKIGNEAFKDCNKITEVEIPESVLEIGENIFAGCSSMVACEASAIDPSEWIGEWEVNTEKPTLTVHSGARVNYVNKGWDKFFNINELPDNYVYSDADDVARTISIAGFSQYAIINGFTEEVAPLSTAVYEGKVYSVIAITGNAFSNNTSVKRVTLPEGVVTLGEKAFYYCSELSEVRMPNSLSVIGNRAFSNCANLKGITFNPGLEKIGDYAFEYAGLSGTLEIPGSVKTIGSYAFSSCRNISALILNEGLERIELMAFYGCDITGELTFPEGVKYIGSRIVSSQNLTHLVLPSTVETIENFAFAYCSNLQKVVSAAEIPASLAAPSNYSSVFPGRELDIPLYIPYGAAHSYEENNWGLYFKLVEPAVYAFDIIDSEAKTVAIAGFSEMAIANGYNQGEISIPSTTMIDDVEYTVVAIAEEAFRDSKISGTVVIPSNILSIGAYAFSGCTEITKVELPDISTIPDGIFEGCRKLMSVNMPASLKSVSPYAFAETAITELVFPAGFESVDQRAFLNCADLITIVFPASLVLIDAEAFNGCNALTHVEAKKKAAPEISENEAFSYLDPKPILNIPATSEASYIENGWADYFDLVEGEMGLTDIFDFYYSGKQAALLGFSTYVKERPELRTGDLVLPTDVEKDGKQLTVYELDIDAFNGYLDEVTSITLPEFIEYIYTGALKGATKVEYLDLPASLIRIDRSVFSGYDNLRYVLSRSISPCELPYGAFDSRGDDKLPLSVPEGSADLYATQGWGRYFNIYEVGTPALPQITHNGKDQFTVSAAPGYHIMWYAEYGVTDALDTQSEDEWTTCTDSQLIHHHDELEESQTYTLHAKVINPITGEQSLETVLSFDNSLMTGISDISTDNEGDRAMYFNLQGVRIQKPQPGDICIKVTDGKAIKMVY